MQMRKEVVERLSYSSWREIETYDKDDLLTASFADIDQIGVFYKALLEGVGGISTGIFSLAICLSINFQLTAISTLALPVIMILCAVITMPISKLTYAAKIQRAKTNAKIMDIIKNIIAVKTYNLENRMDGEIEQSSNALYRTEKKESFVLAIISSINRFFAGSVILLMFSLGAYFVFSSQITVGLFYSFALLFSNIQEFKSIQDIILARRQYNVSKKRLTYILNLAPESQDYPSSSGIRSNDNIIVAKNVSFSYKDTEPIIENLSLSVSRGEHIAIIGHSGSGKSTLLKLLSGIYNPTGGTLCIDGNPVNLNTNFNKYISMIEQSCYLFPGTIRGNLEIAREDLTEDEILDVCKIVGLKNVIENLPLGLESDVSELGSNLSGGERQRICIARAVLKKAPILFMDEPTSALDSISEEIIAELLESRLKNTTVIIVSHRPYLTQFVDKIYRMEYHGELKGVDGVEFGQDDKGIYSNYKEV